MSNEIYVNASDRCRMPIPSARTEVTSVVSVLEPKTGVGPSPVRMAR
jgi:hypothetical protein